MKLLRFGIPGDEKPGVLDSNGVSRDLSRIVQDVAGKALLPEAIARSNELDLASLPPVDPTVRLGDGLGEQNQHVVDSK